MKVKRLAGLLLMTVLLASCGGNRLDTDVSAVQVPDVKIRHFADELFSGDTLHFDQARKTIEAKNEAFAKNFTAFFLCGTDLPDSLCTDTLLRYVKSGNWRLAWENCRKAFSDCSGFEAEIKKSYQYFKHYFPSRQLPASINLTMCGYSSPLTRFSNPVMRFGQDYSIPAEMYLGAKHPGYTWAGFYGYQQQQCVRENLVPDFIRQWMRSEFQNDSLKNDFLTTILAEGRFLYLTDALLRDTPDSLKFRFSGKQLEWCEKNEANIWATFVKKENNILYSIDDKVIRTYVDDGPFTASFDHASPPRTGCWIGYRIVKKYMDDHAGVTLEQLMKMQDLYPIYFSSGYKPKF